MMGTLNDLEYSGEPLTLILPDPSYEHDEKALEESRKRNRELMMEVRNNMRERKYGLYADSSES